MVQPHIQHYGQNQRVTQFADIRFASTCLQLMRRRGGEERRSCSEGEGGSGIFRNKICLLKMESTLIQHIGPASSGNGKKVSTHGTELSFRMHLDVHQMPYIFLL